MTVELVEIQYKRGLSYAAINYETGQMERELTQFMCWLALNHATRGDSKTRGTRPASKSVRQYAYCMKNWYDWISEFNLVAIKSDNNVSAFTWQTATINHIELFISTKDNSKIGSPGTRNQYRTVFKLFYVDFCSYLNISHSVYSGLTMMVRGKNIGSSEDSQNILDGMNGGNTNGKGGDSNKQIAVQEDTSEVLTLQCVDLKELNCLISNFSDPVYGYIAFFMLCTGLRIQPVANLPYPGTTPKENPYWTDPITLEKDLKVDGYFELKYLYKGHEHIGDLYTVEVPMKMWKTIWYNYKPTLDKRVKIWVKEGKKEHNQSKEKYNGRKPPTFWLTENGKPVTTGDIQQAFRESSDLIKENSNRDFNPYFPRIIPRFLRNTYACNIVSSYAEEHGLTLDISDKASLRLIHEYVKQQLGHKSMSTTLKYIRTINKRVYSRLVLKYQPIMKGDGTILNYGMAEDSVDELVNNLTYFK
jgi:hypothetical protein